MINWILKTFTGYKICYATLYYDYIFTHRPFKPPLIKRIKRKGIRGHEAKLVMIDESAGYKPEDN